jgi:hypothetical protein
MSAPSAETIRAQAADLRGADIDEARAAEIAGDMGRIAEALDAVRARLDFNDEPARFDAVLDAAAPRSK